MNAGRVVMVPWISASDNVFLDYRFQRVQILGVIYARRREMP
jgi:hypothetical protein